MVVLSEAGWSVSELPVISDISVACKHREPLNPQTEKLTN
jgi:hypothetical protein